MHAWLAISGTRARASLLATVEHKISHASQPSFSYWAEEHNLHIVKDQPASTSSSSGTTTLVTITTKTYCSAYLLSMTSVLYSGQTSRSRRSKLAHSLKLC